MSLPLWTWSSFLLVIPLNACGGISQNSSAALSTVSDPGEDCMSAAATERSPQPDTPDRISVSHILVRHNNLERAQGATRTPQEACLYALEALQALQSGTSWLDAVNEFSDSGKGTQGALGRVELGDLDSDFGNAAFALSLDELSYVVESSRGYHIIVRTE